MQWALSRDWPGLRGSPSSGLLSTLSPDLTMDSLSRMSLILSVSLILFSEDVTSGIAVLCPVLAKGRCSDLDFPVMASPHSLR